jgi:NAD(P)-dependent dehydrogenase (short-subunit alcohol dehydrogenase family)
MERPKTVLVTGSSDGIGQATARQLADSGYHVIVHARDEEKARRAARALGGDVLSVWGDLSQMAQVVDIERQVTEHVESLDALINNAGTVQRERTVTADGFEATMAINHFAHMLLTLLLHGTLARSAEPRVVTVSSGMHKWGDLDLDDLALSRNWSPTAAYAASKLANVLFAAELARRSGFDRFLSVSLHPGVIRTKLLAASGGGGGSSVDEGARTSVFCVTTPDLQKHNGAFFVNAAPSLANPLVQDAGFRRRFWDRSLALLKPWLS